MYYVEYIFGKADTLWDLTCGKKKLSVLDVTHQAMFEDKMSTAQHWFEDHSARKFVLFLSGN